MPSSRKPTKEEADLAYGVLGGRGDDFFQLIQFKAGLRLLHDEEGLDKDKLAYAEIVVNTRLNALISGLAPRAPKRRLMLREVPEATIASDLLLKFFMDENFDFVLLASTTPSDPNSPLREITIPLNEALYVSDQVSSPFKFKLASIEEGEVMWNLIFGQGLIRTQGESTVVPTVNPFAGTPSTVFGTFSPASSSSGFVSSDSLGAPPQNSVAPQPTPTPVREDFFYKLWCGKCRGYFSYLLNPSTTELKDIKCDKCQTVVVRKAKAEPESITQGN